MILEDKNEDNYWIITKKNIQPFMHNLYNQFIVIL